ncbi:acid ceramidase-like [Branchiostoma floridae]|uniref:Acid ceramidase n=1 Tax=Branchiostoma floridae TaxID=7739 RepID=A0A9J7LIL1_BRAFL|nr:acid ceramidase-like [Branchiostoma floridae]
MEVVLRCAAILVCLLVVVQAQVPPFTEKCEHGMYPPKAESKVASYVINLDLPPAERWTSLAKEKAPQIRDMIAEIKAFAGAFGNGSIIALVDKYLAPLADTLPYPFADELKGIAKATDIPLGEVVLFNVFYEFFTVCTSIVAEDPSGKLFHARNLDFGLFLGWDIKNNTWALSEKLRPIVVNLDWQRGGKTVFKSVNFAGYVGLLTAVKPQTFTYSMNERFSADGGYIGLIEWILGQRDGSWMGFLTREVLENATSFTEAETMLANRTMLAPAYFILGGTKSGEGAIITRSRERALDIKRLDPANGRWFLLQTNYDNWENPPFIDDRRTPGDNCMANMTTANTDLPHIFDVLSSKPVLNKLTTYTALMQVDEGHIESYIQECPDPCIPW